VIDETHMSIHLDNCWRIVIIICGVAAIAVSFGLLFKSNARRARKCEQKRSGALSAVSDQRTLFHQMVSRCRLAGEIPNQGAIDVFERHMAECESSIRGEKSLDRLNGLALEAEKYGQWRAYLCPATEVRTMAVLTLEAMKDWGVSDNGLASFRVLVDEKMQPGINPSEARAALRSILSESDIMRRYTDEYEGELLSYSWKLALSVVILLVLAAVSFYLCSVVPSLFALALFLAGAAGSCISVLSRMPTSEIMSSATSVSLKRRILSRVATGMMASITGCALLAWGLLPIAVNKISFADVLSACRSASDPSCSNTFVIIVLAVPMIFGFSELVLAKLIGRFLDHASGPSSQN
jgi:hypothetical protein